APRGRPRVFVMLPPTPELRSLLHLGRGTANDAIAVDSSAQSADYLLVGRDSADQIGYAWLRPNTRAAAADRRSLPTRTDWFVAMSAADSDVAGPLRMKAISLSPVNG